jgi:hypothetical protein
VAATAEFRSSAKDSHLQVCGVCGDGETLGESGNTSLSMAELMRSAKDGESDLVWACGEGEIVSVDTDGEVGDSGVSVTAFSMSASDGLLCCALSVAA